MHLTEGLLFGWLLLSAMCVAAADRRRGVAGIAAVVTVSQVVLHLLMPPAGATADAMATPTAEMIGWHAAAAIVASLLLAHGERLAWALWSLTGLPRVPLGAQPVPMTASATAVVCTGRGPGRGRILPGGATRRGPPAV